MQNLKLGNLIKASLNRLNRPGLSKHYLSTSTFSIFNVENKFSSKPLNFRYELEINGMISVNNYANILNRIKYKGSCDPDAALELIKYCNIFFIGLGSIKERQDLLNEIFEDILPKVNVVYTQKHYNYYMENTIMNRCSFDPFKISKKMYESKIEASLPMNLYFIKQLCDINDINSAILHLNFLIRSERMNLFDLSEYKTNSLSSDHIFESFLSNLKSTKEQSVSIIKQDLDKSINLINPIFNYYLVKNEASKAKALTEIMKEIRLNPNMQTYLYHINSLVSAGKYDEAEKILSEKKNEFQIPQLLFIYTSLMAKLNGESNHLADVLTKMLDKTIKISDKIFFINEIFHLCERKMFDDAFYLVKRFFKSDLSSKNYEKLDVGVYFAMSFVFNSTKLYEDINKYSALLDANVSDGSNKYFSKTIELATPILRSDLVLGLFYKLKLYGNKIHYGHLRHILYKAVDELDAEAKSRGSLTEHGVKSLVKYELLKSILNKARLELEFSFSPNNLSTFLKLLRCENNHKQKSYLRFYDIFHLIKDTKTFENADTLFASCFKRIILDLSYSLVESDDTNFIYYNFQDLFDILSETTNLTLNNSGINELNDYLSKLFAANFVRQDLIDYKANIIFRTVELINEKKISGDSGECLIRLNETLLNYLNAITADGQEKQSLKEYFEKNFISDKEKARVQAKKDFQSLKAADHSYSAKPLKDLENLLDKTPEKNAALIRTILIRLCTRSESKLPSTKKRVEDLLAKLPENELSPLVCECLMDFYSRYTFDIEKSKHYFEKMIMLNHTNEFVYNRSRMLFFIQKLFYCKKDVKEIEKCFRMFSIDLVNKNYYRTDENEKELMADLNSFLSEGLYSEVEPNELNNLVEIFYANGFVERNMDISNLIMLKYIDKEDFRGAIKYFKTSLDKHKMSVLESLLFTLLSKSKRLEERNMLLNYFSNVFTDNLTYNIIFLSFLLNKEYSLANGIYERSLDGKMDIKVLERLVAQMISNKLFNKYYHLMYNVIKSPQVSKNAELRETIEKLINTKFRKN
jgi:hypothetical protein